MLDRPQARTEGIVRERVDDDLVVYDQVSHTAHSLSAAAASVWEICDGEHSSGDMAATLALEPEMVARALHELGECGLLDEGPVVESGYSRREAAVRLAKIGGAAFAAPMIYSVAIGPAMAAASTCIATGATGCNATHACCNGSADCNSGRCCCPNGSAKNCCSQDSDCCKVNGNPGSCGKGGKCTG